jgi:hypothetical protein
MDTVHAVTPERHQQAVEAMRKAVEDHIRECPACGPTVDSYCHHGWNLYYSYRMLEGMPQPA